MNSVEDLERKLDQLLKEPDNSQLFNEIGVLLYQMKDLKSAEMYLLRAYQLSTINEDILYNYGLLLYLNSQWEKTIHIYKAYLELHENDKEVMEKMGDSYYLLGEYESAAKMYEQLQK